VAKLTFITRNIYLVKTIIKVRIGFSKSSIYLHGESLSSHNHEKRRVDNLCSILKGCLGAPARDETSGRILYFDVYFEWSLEEYPSSASLSALFFYHHEQSCSGFAKSSGTTTTTTTTKTRGGRECYWSLSGSILSFERTGFNHLKSSFKVILPTSFCGRKIRMTERTGGRVRV